MKNRLLKIFSASIALLIISSGCKAVPQERIESRVKLVTQIAAGEALIEKPQWRIGFEQAAADLQVLESTDNVGIGNLIAIIERLPVKQLQSPRARLYIATGTSLILEESGVPTELSPATSDKVQGLARAIRQGIQNALAVAFPSSASTTPGLWLYGTPPPATPIGLATEPPVIVPVPYVLKTEARID